MELVRITTELVNTMTPNVELSLPLAIIGCHWLSSPGLAKGHNMWWWASGMHPPSTKGGTHVPSMLELTPPPPPKSQPHTAAASATAPTAPTTTTMCGFEWLCSAHQNRFCGTLHVFMVCHELTELQLVHARWVKLSQAYTPLRKQDCCMPRKCCVDSR